MSTPHIAWAFAQRGLTTVQRVVLIALAERANGERTCFPSFPTLATDCEVSERAVIAAVQYLHHERHFIEVVDDPAERAAILDKAGARITTRSNVYRILRPDDTAPRAPSRHYNGARHAPSSDHIPAPRAPSMGNPARNAPSTPSEGANGASRACSKRHHEHARRAPESLNESLHEKKRAAQGQDSGGKEASEASQAASQQAAHDAPQHDPSLTSDGQPRANAESVHRAAMAAIRALRATAPASHRAPSLAHHEQMAACQATEHDPPLDAPLPPVHPAVAEHVLAARRELAQRAAQRQSVAA